MIETTLGIRTTTIANQQTHDVVFPQVIEAVDSNIMPNQVLQWVASAKPELLEALSLHGALVFRGFPLRTDIEFDAFIQAFSLPAFTYTESLSNAVRRNRTERVFTANEAPASVSIYLHHEMAQTPIFPSRLFFFCEHAAAVGGATPLCRSDILLERISTHLPLFLADCVAKGVRYTNVMPAEEDLESGQGRSWRSTLNAPDAAAAEARLQTLGYQWQWLEDGSLKATTPVLPAVRELADGRKVFFNQLIAAFRGWQDRRNQSNKTICFGDGSAISTEDMAAVITMGDELTFDMQWQTGDVALVDNFLVMHGRRPYIGERRVLAALVA